MPPVTTAPGKGRGFWFDKLNSRLAILYGGTAVVRFNASGFSTPNSEIVNSVVQTAGLAAGAVTGAKLATNARTHFARSEAFNLDNGAGTTIDDVILRPSTAITITAARIVYSDATSGTVAAGTAQVGTTVAGAEIVAATAYENAKAVGTTTAMTIASGAVAANTPIIVRHTGVAATQAGEAHVEITYTVND